MVLTENLGHDEIVQTLDVQTRLIFVPIHGEIRRQPVLKGIQIATLAIYAEETLCINIIPLHSKLS